MAPWPLGIFFIGFKFYMELLYDLYMVHIDFLPPNSQSDIFFINSKFDTALLYDWCIAPIDYGLPTPMGNRQNAPG